MVSGFDLSKATEKDHKETPLKQTISISYGGEIFTYEISIIYSGVSIIKDRLEIFSDIDWSNDDSVVTPEQGQAAIEAMQEYNNISSSAEKKLISKDELNTIVRTAAFWATISYKEELKNYSDIIVLNGSQIGLTGTDPEKVAQSVAKFKDKNEKLNVYAELIRDLIDDYPDVIIANNVTVEQYAFVLSKEVQNEIAGIYQHFIEIYNLLEPIDKVWDDAELLANLGTLPLFLFSDDSFNCCESYERNVVFNFPCK
jgi:ribosomal protein S17E